VKLHRILAELDLHYLVIPAFFSILALFFFGHLHSARHELAISVAWSIVFNALAIVLSFLGIAPWGFTWDSVRRCFQWVLVSFVVGAALSFVILLPRSVLALALHGF